MSKSDQPAGFSRRSLLFGSFLKRDKPWDPKPPEAPAQDLAPLLAKANQAFAAGDLEAALGHYREYVLADMDNMEVRRRLVKNGCILCFP